MSAIVCLHGLRRTPSDWDGVRPGLEAIAPVRTPVEPGFADGDIVIGHSLGGVIALRRTREGAQPRALVLTGCFFPPARNGRSLATTVADYAGHRVAFLREARGAPTGERSARSPQALAGLAAQAFRRDERPVGVPVLVVHARDDHHVPVDFALAAIARQGWDSAILDRGGHHAHVATPDAWLAAVEPWLRRVAG